MMTKNSGHAAQELMLDYLRTRGFKFSSKSIGPVQPVHEGYAHVMAIPVDESHYVEFVYCVRAFPLASQGKARTEYNRIKSQFAMSSAYDNMTVLTLGVRSNYGIVILTTPEEDAKLTWALGRYVENILKMSLDPYKEGTHYNPLRPHRICFQYDPESRRILGGMTKQEAMHCAQVMQALKKAWREEFGNDDVPAERLVADAEPLGIPVYDLADDRTYIIPIANAFELPELSNTPPELREMVIQATQTTTTHRLALTDAATYRLYRDSLKIKLKSFATKLFAVIRVAHKRIAGTFTDNSGSSLFTSNVGIDGCVHDYETFHSEKLFPGDRVHLEYQHEDIRLAFEALREFVALDSPDNIRDAFLKGAQIAHVVYTGASLTPSEDNLAGLCAREFGDNAPPPQDLMPFSGLSSLLVEGRQWQPF